MHYISLPWCACLARFRLRLSRETRESFSLSIGSYRIGRNVKYSVVCDASFRIHFKNGVHDDEPARRLLGDEAETILQEIVPLEVSDREQFKYEDATGGVRWKTAHKARSTGDHQEVSFTPKEL